MGHGLIRGAPSWAASLVGIVTFAAIVVGYGERDLAGKAQEAGLRSVVGCASNVINGSAPQSIEGFESLRRLGVRSIISVDAFPPDVPKARAHGMSYVQIPIGYEGVTRKDALTLMRAIRDLPRPIYIHCFHGRERSPAAAAVALVGLGELTKEEALKLLRRAGTSEKYIGLWHAVRSAERVSDDVLNAVPSTITEVATVSSLRSAMAHIGRTWDHLEEIRDTGWTPPPSHPDLKPEPEAERLLQLFVNLADEEVVKQKDESFRNELATAITRSRELSRAVESGNRAAATASMTAVRETCSRCHTAHRDFVGLPQAPPLPTLNGS